MIKLFAVLLSIVGIVLGSYVLITKNFEIIPYQLLVLGVLLLIAGSVGLKADRKISGIFSVIAAAFVLFVAIYTF